MKLGQPAARGSLQRLVRSVFVYLSGGEDDDVEFDELNIETIRNPLLFSKS